MTATVLRANAATLPLADESVDLIVTSPPYFALRSYQDGCETCDGTGITSDDAVSVTRPALGPTMSPKSTLSGGKRDRSGVARGDGSGCPTCDGTGKGHYQGQLGSEPTPAEFVDALLAATREMVRVLKRSGSLWVNLGDKYGTPGSERSRNGEGHRQTAQSGGLTGSKSYIGDVDLSRPGLDYGVRAKSLIGIPWRYALRCIDTTSTGHLHVNAVRDVLDDLADGTIDRAQAHRRIDELEEQAADGSPGLGLILRAEVIWSKPNGLPESVTDRVRRSHEQWFHFVRQPRYFSAVDEIREAHEGLRAQLKPRPNGRSLTPRGPSDLEQIVTMPNPLGKLPGSVWTIPTQPLTVPAHLGVDHFAAFPMEWPRRIIQGWSPRGVCTACGEGRRPVVDKKLVDVWHDKPVGASKFVGQETAHQNNRKSADNVMMRTFGSTEATITGYACACPDTTAPTRPAIILDPFGGTGTTALVAHALGRHGISVDLSHDYCRLARWRTTDEGEYARALQVDKPAVQIDGQGSLLDLLEEAT